MTPSADLSTILNRILDTAADNLRVAKILIQLGLDPDNITYDAIFNRLTEIIIANITLANMFALVGAIFFVATLLTRTIVPLRVANMFGCAFFAGFGALAGDIKTFLLYFLLLPINAIRLRQMLNLVKKARNAANVFFDKLDHVGIYLGDSLFIDAPHTGTFVRIDSLTEPGYKKNYVGARRI